MPRARRPRAAGGAAAIEDLKSLGIEVALLSGDRSAAVVAAAKEAAIDQARGDLDPQAKLEVLKSPGAPMRGGILMIGDGVNDAPGPRCSNGRGRFRSGLGAGEADG